MVTKVVIDIIIREIIVEAIIVTILLTLAEAPISFIKALIPKTTPIIAATSNNTTTKKMAVNLLNIDHIQTAKILMINIRIVILKAISSFGW